jgi:hypothetical protein
VGGPARSLALGRALEPPEDLSGRKRKPTGKPIRSYINVLPNLAENHMIKGLHHNAYRCSDSEKTRAFYEDFLGLPLVSAFEIDPGVAS